MNYYDTVITYEQPTDEELKEMYNLGDDTLKRKLYRKRIAINIAKRYDDADEKAVQRQRNIKAIEFEEYNIYCDKCVEEAKKFFGRE